MTDKELHEFLSMWKDGDMTNQEAMAKFKDIMRAEIDRIPSHYDAEAEGEVYSDTYKVDEILKLNKVVCKALEKQIPKKPICVEDKMWCCPKCDNNLLNKWVKYPTKLVPKSAGLPYCMSCGQALNWEED